MSERSEAIGRAVAAYRSLGELAETIEDEWQYVNDLVDAYAPALEALAAGEPITAEQVGAIDEAVAEIGLIADPHKAIDWLSTFPHVVALAVGGDVDAPADATTTERTTEPAGSAPADDDDDNPFAALLRRGR